MSWLINRNMRLTGQYTFTTQSGTGTLTPVGATGVNTLVNGSYNQNLFLLTLHLGL